MKYIIIILFIFIVACQSAPDRKDFKLDPCFSAADCLYRNQKNPDKSVCKDYISECNSFSKYEYCKQQENLPEGVDFQKCWIYLNQK